jgi:hypothetical protein
MAEVGDRPDAPDGIEQRHIGPRGASWMAWLGLGLLAVLVGVSALGVYGREHTLEGSGNGIRASVHLPELLRNGEFFEMQFSVDLDEPVEDLIIGVETSVWEDMTINTVIPGASEESSVDGEYRFAFGPMAAGDVFVAKIDGQVNPDIWGGNSGAIRVYDGERLLVELPVEIGVLP